MHRHWLWLTAGLTLSLGVVALSWAVAQPPAVPATTPAITLRPKLDPTKLAKQDVQFYYAAHAGANWLRRSNRRDGRFGYVNSPALRTRQDFESFPRQASAAAALGQAASLLGDEQAAALATQAVLTLLVETTVDDAKRVRTPSIRASLVHPLTAAGALLQAIHALPAPGADLLEQSEQLCQFVRSQQRADGALAEGDDDLAAGEALLGLMRSQQHRPAPWKLDLVRKAHAYYQPRWQANKIVVATPRLCAAWAEAHQHTKEPAFAQSVFAMADWLCTLQYQQLEPARALWFGGFQGWSEGKAVIAPPDATAALYAQALADGRRTARLAADAPRHKRYQDALEKSLLFLLPLQYTDASTRHFTEWFRPEVLGSFHASYEDGNLRLDYTSNAVGALVQYFTYGAER